MDTPHDTQPVRPLPVALAAILFIAFFTAFPLAWLFLALPLALEPAGRWLYVLSAVGISALVAVVGQPHPRRRHVFQVVALMLLSVALLFAALGAMLGMALEGFLVTERIAELPSPDGQLVLAHEYIDQGALGGDNLVYVHGRFLPGIVNWRYEIHLGVDEYPGAMAWSEERAVVINDQSHAIPDWIIWLSW